MHRMDYFMVALLNLRTLGEVFLFTCFILFFIQCGIAFDTLRVYDNATLLQFKCRIKVLLCSMFPLYWKIKMYPLFHASKTDGKFPFA